MPKFTFSLFFCLQTSHTPAQGGFASVRIMRHNDGCNRAVKFYSNIEDLKMNINEAVCLSKLSHPNIIAIKGAGPNIIEGTLDYIVLEAAENLSLQACETQVFLAPMIMRLAWGRLVSCCY